MRAVLALDPVYMIVVLLPLFAVLLAASITDLHSRKIYNKLTYPSFLLGLVMHTIAFGIVSTGWALGGAVVVFVAGLLIMPLGWFKAGDTKLFMVVTAFLGLRGLMAVGFYSVLVGAIAGICVQAFSGRLLFMLKRLWKMLKGLLYSVAYKDRNLMYTIDAEDKSTYIPFAPAIFMGALLAYTDLAYGLPGLMVYYFKKVGIAL